MMGTIVYPMTVGNERRKMAQKAPGKHYRKGLTLVEIIRMFPDDAAAEAWFAETRWPHGPACPYCGSVHVLDGAKHATMRYRCREKGCRKRFSLKTGTVMEASNIGYQKWAIAIYLSLTSLKSVSSMKLHRDLGITQKSAWHMAHRLRRSFAEKDGPFSGPVEVDEKYMGGKRKNMSNAKRKALAGTGRGAVGKTAVVGMKDRATNQVRAQVTERTDKPTLQGFVVEHTSPAAMIYTDEASAYEGLPRDHETVNHSVSEYVRGMAHTNGIESFWAMLERAHKGTFHKMSPKHLDRYVKEFAGKHNLRESDTPDQMRIIVEQMDGKRLKYRDLIKDNGLDSGAREAVQ